MDCHEKYNNELIAVADGIRALAHPARLQIIEYLSGYYECPAGCISNELPLCKSTVSQHMAKLREMGFISCSPDGNCLNYTLNEEKLQNTLDSLNYFFAELKTQSQNKKDCDKLSKHL